MSEHPLPFKAEQHFRDVNRIFAEQESRILQLQDERDYYRNLLNKAMKMIKTHYFMLTIDGERKWDDFVNNDMEGYDGTIE